MKEQFTQGDWINEGTTVYALQDSTRRGKPIKINRFQFNIQGKCSDEELLANAVLAKAAPKMYRMLQEQSEMMKMLDEYTHPNIELDAVKADIDLLLAEARGENNE